MIHRTLPRLAALAALCLSALPGVSAAQETDPNLGEPVLETPQLGREYVREEHGDWAVRCLRTEQVVDPCSLYQLLLDDQGNTVAEINVFPLPQAQNDAIAGATLIAPLETFLPAGVTMSVDGGPARRYPFEFCTPVGCFSRLGFTAADVDGLRRGAVANVRIVPATARDQSVDLSVSLIGFTAGYAALQ